MGIPFSSIVTQVEEKVDGRSFGTVKHQAWADTLRSGVAHNAFVGGFHGLYFLYKEATVRGGSVVGEGRVAVPDDFVDDLNVWYDGILLAKAAPGVLAITLGAPADITSSPSGDAGWVAMAGLEFEIRPTPQEAGKEIKLFYNALPELVSGPAFTDYFLDHFQDLHIYGMAEKAAQSVGATNLAREYGKYFQREAQALQLANRRWYLKGVKIRFQNWDEFEEQKKHVFPQFGPA